MLNWKPYNQHDWEKSKQHPFNSAEKLQFEKLAAKILWVPGAELNDYWATVHPPGRNATVIQMHPFIRHRFEWQGVRPIGLKIFNLVDGKVMWPSVFRFHESQRNRLPGLPNPHVQEVLDCDVIQDDHGVARGYLVQQWVEGVVLKEKIQAGLSAAEVLQIADDLFQEIIIPLWSNGSSWWDVRDSNYVVTPDGRLMMIDSDSVGAYADEILQTPKVFAERNHGSITAMKRYATILVAMAGRQAVRGTKTIVQREVRALFVRHLQPVFVEPYADRFEQPKTFTGRMAKAARWAPPSAAEIADKPWLTGAPRMIFISDMGDALSQDVDFEFLKKEIIESVDSIEGSRHLWLWLTKRPVRMAEFGQWLVAQGINWPDNLVAMTTVTSHATRGRVDELRKVPAKFRGLSCEPIYSELDLDLTGIDWLIAGGGSDIFAEPFHVEWALQLQKRCRESGTAFFLKQLGRNPFFNGQSLSLTDGHGGDWDKWPEPAWRVREIPAGFRR